MNEIEKLEKNLDNLIEIEKTIKDNGSRSNLNMGELRMVAKKAQTVLEKENGYITSLQY